MERQREKARASWAGSGDVKTAGYWFPLREKYGALSFLGMKRRQSRGVVQTISRGGPEFSGVGQGKVARLFEPDAFMRKLEGKSVTLVGLNERLNK